MKKEYSISIKVSRQLKPLRKIKNLDDFFIFYKKNGEDHVVTLIDPTDINDVINLIKCLKKAESKIKSAFPFEYSEYLKQEAKEKEIEKEIREKQMKKFEELLNKAAEAEKVSKQSPYMNPIQVKELRQEEE